MPVESPSENYSVYQQLIEAKDAAGIAARFAEHGVVVSTGTPNLVGREAIRRSFAAMFQNDLSVDITLDRLTLAGDIALEITSFKMSMNGRLVATGKSAVVMQRQPDGDWLILVDDPSIV